MSTPLTPGWTPTLRYSPVNGIIVNWGYAGEPFSMCGMPQRPCEEDVAPKHEAACTVQAMAEPVDTYDWFKWVPEIIAGIQEASEDAAATYARRAAIEFATKTRCLQRVVALRLQPNVYRYPATPFEQERAKGVISAETAAGMCSCESSSCGIDIGKPRIHLSTQEIRFDNICNSSCGRHCSNTGPEYVLVKIWAAPTEDSCAHDAMLWDDYRAEITKGARAAFIQELHSIGMYKTQRGYANYRGDGMVIQQAQLLRAQFERDMIRVRAEATSGGDLNLNGRPSNLFAGRGGCRSC